MAFTGIAALVAGEAVTAAVVLSAVAEVGMVMTVVGAVTGDKDLMKLGGVMGLVGGIGGMLAGAAGGAAATAGAEGALSEAANVGAANALSDASYAGADWAGSGLDAAASSGAESLISTAAAPSVATVTPVNPVTPLESSLSPAAAQPVAATPVQAPAADNLAVRDVAAPQAVAGAQAPTTPWEADFPGSNVLTGPNAGLAAPKSSSSFLSGFMDFANKNKTLFSTGMQLVGGALKGANESAMWDERMALEQQRLKQTSYGNQVANFAPGAIIAGARA